MGFAPWRLRRGEVIVGASAVSLLVFMLFFTWYGLSGVLAPTASRLGASTSVTGWDGLAHVRWLVVVTIAASLALVYFQATRRAPAVPVSLSVIVTVLALLTALALLYRVVINVPGGDGLYEQKAGAFLALASALVLVYGGYLSMRSEGIAERDAPREIKTVQLGDGS
jgi:Mn2+/Fe2+ NRAMP family transporter